MEVKHYLERIGYRGPVDVSARTLASLQRAHLHTVPFENLDVCLGREIVLEPAALYDKIVVRRRGGFCYELNGLFAWLLTELGFEVTLLSARVFGERGLGPEFDHLSLRVDLSEPWLVDVGFGDGFAEPLRLGSSAPQIRRGLRHRLLQTGPATVYTTWNDEVGWVERYLFCLTARTLADFTDMCTIHQTSPDSVFKKRRLATIATRQGRVTLSGDTLIVTDAWGRHEREVPDSETLEAVLKDHFGIVL